MTGRIDPRTPTYNLGGTTRELLTQAGVPNPGRNWLLDIINDPRRMYYCTACDEMVEILKIPGFKPPPAWRSDIFRWRR